MELSSLQLHKLYTQHFWDEFGGRLGRKGTSRKSKAATIRALKELGEVKLVWRKAYTPSKNRELYQKKRTYKGYNGFKLCLLVEDRLRYATT